MDIYKRKHVYLIPEDDEDRQIANGFKNNLHVDDRQIKFMPVAGGWRKVLRTFVEEYIPILKSNVFAHVILLIDCDEEYIERRAEFERAIPDGLDELKSRVFVIGPRNEPKDLRGALDEKLEKIGSLLADDCFADTLTIWSHEHLRHNDPDRLRLVDIVKPILFGIPS